MTIHQQLVRGHLRAAANLAARRPISQTGMAGDMVESPRPGELLTRRATDGSLVPLILSDGRPNSPAKPTSPTTTPRSARRPVLTDLVTELPTGTIFQLDSLPEDSATAVATHFDVPGWRNDYPATPSPPCSTLPDTFDEYLAGISKEGTSRTPPQATPLRVGSRTSTTRTQTGSGGSCTLRRPPSSIHGDKGSFMTPEMEHFFLALHTEAGGVIDVLLDGEGRPAPQSSLSKTTEGFYLYNSAYEPELRNHSPGNVMLSHLIERSIEDGKKVFDFLKGDETYKFRLGAQPRPLFEVAATVGASG